MFDLALCQIQGIIFPYPRFRSFSRSLSRPRFGSFNQPIECYYCHCMGHTANNCFRHQNKNVHIDNLIKVGETITEILKDIQTTDQILDIEQPTLLSVELIFQSHQCIQIYRQGINDKH